jgi:T4 RnlA family RNA ligase
MTNYKKTFDELVEEGWLISQVHPTLDLTIYNYSQKTQYEGYWTLETLATRGLVLNSEGRVVARPFGKFFNASEVPGQIPNLPFEVYEKMDGSLGIFFWYSDENGLHPVFASRGSFTSEQAVKGWEMLQKLNYHELAYNHTHIFEIIYPENRIVVDYGMEEKLVLLGVIETVSGREISRKDLEANFPSGFEMVKRYDFEDYRTIQSLNWQNHEGFVVRFSDGYRVKLKFEDYVRLHRIITQVSSIDIWEKLKNNEPLDEILEAVPDEFYDWVRKTERDLRYAHSEILWDAHDEFTRLTSRLGESERKEYALALKDYPHKSIVFRFLDGRDANDIAWKLVRPEYSKPFSNIEI